MDPAIGTLLVLNPVKQCKTTVLLQGLLVHFKNRVITRVTALLNGPSVKTVKTVKQSIKACIGLHGLSGLSRRSLVSTFGTPDGRGAAA